MQEQDYVYRIIKNSPSTGFMWNDVGSSATDYKIGKMQVSWYKLGIRHAQTLGKVVQFPEVGGLHNHYDRLAA